MSSSVMTRKQTGAPVAQNLGYLCETERAIENARKKARCDNTDKPAKKAPRAKATKPVGKAPRAKATKPVGKAPRAKKQQLVEKTPVTIIENDEMAALYEIATSLPTVRAAATYVIITSRVMKGLEKDYSPSNLMNCELISVAGDNQVVQTKPESVNISSSLWKSNNSSCEKSQSEWVPLLSFSSSAGDNSRQRKSDEEKFFEELLEENRQVSLILASAESKSAPSSRKREWSVMSELSTD